MLIPGEILEQIVNLLVCEHHESNKVITISQHGFFKNKSWQSIMDISDYEVEEENIIDFQPVAQETPGLLPVNDEGDSMQLLLFHDWSPTLGECHKLEKTKQWRLAWVLDESCYMSVLKISPPHIENKSPAHRPVFHFQFLFPCPISLSISQILWNFLMVIFCLFWIALVFLGLNSSN